MTDDREATPEPNSRDRREELDARYRSHEPGNLEALEHVPEDGGSGPFGVDMSQAPGGTRHQDDTDNLRSSAYNTGASPKDGGSLTPDDPRTRFDHEGTGDTDSTSDQDNK